MKKISALLLSFAMCISLCSCGGNGNDSEENTQVSDNKTSDENTFYYLNFKPEVAEIYKEIASVYENETGVKMNVVTAASGTYEQTLKSEIAKADAPVLFQINGPKGYASWKNYCEDISDTEIYSHLIDKELAITDGDGVYGIPYVIEGYGIIYNNAIMKNYFSSPNKQTDYNSVDEINNFAALKAVVEDMTSMRDDLGIKGVFASTSLKSGDDWRFHSHLANIPMYYEFKEKNVDYTGDDTKTAEFKYADNFRNTFDLYINNSTTDRKLLGSKQVADSMAEFALGQCAMVQNGNWAWNQINGIDGNVVDAEDIGFLPIYTGIDGEEKQGICIGTENFLAINSNASDAKQQLAADFLMWLYSSDTGKKFVTEQLGFIAPFDTFTDEERPADPLAQEVINWMEKDGIENVPWTPFTIFPSQNFKDDFGSSLLSYAQGSSEWEDVKSTFTDSWESESK